MDSETEDRIRSLIENNLDWEYLIQIATRHKLRPLLYSNLKEFSGVSEVFKRNIGHFYRENAQKNLFFLGELFKILDLLESGGIVAIPFKGPILSILIYKNIALREFNDLDIFVDQENVIKSREVLISNGYEQDLFLDKLKEKKYVESQHEYQFINQKNNYLLELHWKFSELFFFFPNDELDVIDLHKLNSTYINGRNIKFFSSEDLFLILCLHNAGHRWARLSWICDIGVFLHENKKLEWDKIFNNATRMGISRIILINLYLSKILLGSEFPKSINNILKSDKDVKNVSEEIINEIFSKDPISSQLSQELIMKFRIREKFIYGLMDVIKNGTKPTIRDWKIIPLPIYLYPLYYLLRPIRLIIGYRI
ncbi:nucleotidyltransferase family protein [Methanobacterium sp.]|uniref:nucleotidyltransferase domain-containing protein n=1 Tax=Methanobacterium sp. TaxID=2164 RepID=UPI002AB80ED8|nr:nucleotidyltransferase family protein [Methanobacterium sp.]MDY9922940.1 nucleotidyltransferase family protein [Methanobacterium sp.]